MAKLSTTHIYGDLYVDGIVSGALSGNATTATTLQTARTINGTSFNGSANITTANWGTSRTITIGSTGKSVNGSGNVSWTLAEIGAAAASHGRHVPDTCTSITDWNSATTTGWYMGSGVANAPSTAWHMGYVIAHNTNYVFQTVYNFNASSDAKGVPKFIRCKMNGTWGAWTNVTVAKAVPSDAKFTDTNTWRGIQNNLTSDATDQSLSAAQGKALKGLVDGKAASSHNHGLLHDSHAATLSDTTTDSGWSMINSSYNGFILKAIRSNANAPAWHCNNYAAGIAFGGGDTKGVLSCAYNAPSIKIAGGNGTKPVWWVGLQGTSGTTYDLNRINTAYNHSQAGHAPSNAQKNSDITKAEIEAKLTGAITSHTHSYAASSHTHNYAASSHTHNYAGSGSAGGAANSANILNINNTETKNSGRLQYFQKSNDSTIMPDTGWWSLIRTQHTGYDNGYWQEMAYAFGSDTVKFRRNVNGTKSAWKTVAWTDHNHDSTYAKASHGTHLTIGTGASNAAAGNHTHSGYASSSHSHSSLNIKGDNTITSKSNDTTANWGSHGNSVHWYTATGQLTDQPSQWGYILNIGKTSEVHQIWMTQASGDMFHRGGNAGGWSGSWRKLLDSSNYSSLAAPASHNHTQLTGEVRFPGSGTYTDPWSGTTCCIKGTGNLGITGGLRANGGVATCGTACGCATSDGATYVGNFRYAQSRGICDLGTNSIPGRIYLRSGQGTAGSGIYIENRVTDGNAYMQYLSPEAGTIALTKHLSDRTRKENIAYVDSEESEFTNKDFYNFIKDDLDLATYNLKKEYASTDTHTKLNFIAQDILWDFEKNEENKVGNLIVQAEEAMEEQLSLKYDPEVFTSVIAGALKEAINKIEQLEAKIEQLESK